MPTFDEWIRISVIVLVPLAAPVPVVDDRAADDRHARVVHRRVRRDHALVDRRRHRQRLERRARLVLVGDDLRLVAVGLLRVVDLVGGQVVGRVVGRRQDVARVRLHDQDQPAAGFVVDDRLVEQALGHALHVAIDASAPGPSPARGGVSSRRPSVISWPPVSFSVSITPGVPASSCVVAQLQAAQPGEVAADEARGSAPPGCPRDTGGPAPCPGTRPAARAAGPVAATADGTPLLSTTGRSLLRVDRRRAGRRRRRPAPDSASSASLSACRRRRPAIPSTYTLS